MNRWLVIDTTLRCPLCGEPTTIRSSRKVTDLLREEYVDCTNVNCPGRFKVNREIVASLFEGSYAHGLKIPEYLRRQTPVGNTADAAQAPQSAGAAKGAQEA